MRVDPETVRHLAKDVGINKPEDIEPGVYEPADRAEALADDTGVPAPDLRESPDPTGALAKTLPPD